MPLILFAVAASSILNVSRNLQQQVQRACIAPAGTQPKVAGIRIEQRRSNGRDLGILRVTDAASGGWMNVYFDQTASRIAKARAACLGYQIHLLAIATGNVWRTPQWYSVVFTKTANYIPPRRTREKRWHIKVNKDGSLTGRSQEMVTLVMPHEQVHAFQQRAGATTPRWFHEGHAEWIARKIAKVIAPQAARAQDRGYSDALKALGRSPKLSAWGGVSVTREAILRQASPADRRRMEADPNFVPAGPFSFGPADMTSDESDTGARYEAAWRAFRTLEDSHGTRTVEAWAASITAGGGAVRNEEVLAQAHAAFGEDLAPRLK